MLIICEISQLIRNLMVLISPRVFKPMDERAPLGLRSSEGHLIVGLFGAPI